MMNRSTFVGLICCVFLPELLGGVPAISQAPAPLNGPIVIIEESARLHQLSRNPQGLLRFDSSGTLHLVHWEGGFASTPTTPSRVWWRRWNRASGWENGQQVDDSRLPSLDPIGGRHPSLLDQPEGFITIAWHDHRHTTAFGNWIDNVELYGVQVPRDLPFGSLPLAGNLRLTSTSNPGFGDNSLVPRPISLSQNRIGILWYDFGLNPTSSDLFFAETGNDGLLAPVAPFPLSSSRLTTASLRAAGAAWTLVDGAVTSDGTIHLVWMEGTGAGDLYTATLAGTPPALSNISVLAAGAADFLDPPRIVTGSDGAVWIVARDAQGAGGGQIVLWRKAPLANSFGPALRPVSGMGPRAFPAAQPDDQGRLWLAYSDRGVNPSRIRIVLYDPQSNTLDQNWVVSEPGNFTRLALARIVDELGRDQLALVAEEIRNSTTSRLLFWTTLNPSFVARDDWELYQ